MDTPELTYQSLVDLILSGKEIAIAQIEKEEKEEKEQKENHQ